jgi:GAF domain-containing protein
MMQMLADNQQKRPLEPVIEEMDENSFRQSLAELTDESQHFLEATRKAEDMAFQSMLERALRVFTKRLAGLLDAERASLLLIDEEQQELIMRISQDLEGDKEVRIPIGEGIAGVVASSGEAIRIDDAYADSRFNPKIDQKSGFRTRSILCLPLRDQSGKVFAVTQLLNRKDGEPFDAADEQKFTQFADSLGVILEALHRLHSDSVSDRRTP